MVRDQKIALRRTHRLALDCISDLLDGPEIARYRREYENRNPRKSHAELIYNKRPGGLFSETKKLDVNPALLSPNLRKQASRRAYSPEHSKYSDSLQRFGICFDV